MAGWVKVYRCLLDKLIWKKSTPEQKTILITLLLMANHQPNEWEWEGKRFKVFPGQFITSLDSVAKKAGVTVQNVRTAITKFEKYEFLTNQSTKTGRLITIVNWQDYQAEEIKPNKPPNKELTKSQQRANKELTTNKNDKNDKNDKKKIYYADYVSMTVEEYEKLLNKFHKESVVKDWIERLNVYKGSTGKKYASDYMTILNWHRRDEKEKPKPKLEGVKM